jgi:hypothetical protein
VTESKIILAMLSQQNAREADGTALLGGARSKMPEIGRE